MNFLELAKSRYSVRKFSDRPVEPGKLALVLEAARIAPTAHNNQPWRIYVLQSEAALGKLSALSPCTFGAKTILLFAYHREEEWRNPLEEGVAAGVEDVSIAATHAMLEAADLGLGTCWCNYFPNSQAERALGLPPDERAVLFMPIGYPAADAAPSPMHSAKRPAEELVRRL